MVKIQVSEELATVIDFLKSERYKEDMIMMNSTKKLWDNNSFLGYNVELLNQTEPCIIKQLLNGNFEIEKSIMRGVGRAMMFELNLGCNENISVGKTIEYKSEKIEIVNILGVNQTKENTIVIGVGRIL